MDWDAEWDEDCAVAAMMQDAQLAVDNNFIITPDELDRYDLTDEERERLTRQLGYSVHPKRNLTPKEQETLDTINTLNAISLCIIAAVGIFLLIIVIAAG